MNTTEYMHKLDVMHALRQPVLEKLVNRFNPEPGSSGIDAGCGIGQFTAMLADRVGAEGSIIGVDLSSEFIREATSRYAADNLSFLSMDVYNLPDQKNLVDWIFSMDCVGYRPGNNPAGDIKELAKVVKPGGKIGIAFWSSQLLLPGYPELEAKLNQTLDGIGPFHNGMPPEHHPMRLTGQFRKAGLEACELYSIAHAVYAPLSADIRQALIELIDMRWSPTVGDVGQEELDLYNQLTDPKSSRFILDEADYAAQFTYTLVTGTKGS